MTSTLAIFVVGCVVIGGLVQVGKQATNKLVKYFGQEVDDQNKKNQPYIEKERDDNKL